MGLCLEVIRFSARNSRRRKELKFAYFILAQSSRALVIFLKTVPAITPVSKMGVRSRNTRSWVRSWDWPEFLINSEFLGTLLAGVAEIERKSLSVPFSAAWNPLVPLLGFERSGEAGLSQLPCHIIVLFGVPKGIRTPVAGVKGGRLTSKWQGLT
jgi:hypothetical protein